MTPVVSGFTLRRGDTPSLGLILEGQHVASNEIVPLPQPGHVVVWTIGWPGASRTCRTDAATSDPTHRLSVDPRTRAIAYPVTAADVATLIGSAVAPYAVQLIESDGRTTTYLVGTINAEG